MADLLLTSLPALHLFGVVALLLPMLPLPIVLLLERSVLSKQYFSGVWLVIFRIGFVASVFLASYLTYILALMLWN
jgi:hypothetical protein